jgi:hypothetical protein
MGNTIARLLNLFRDRVPDTESFAHVLELALTSERWSAAHGVFDEIRGRLLESIDAKDEVRGRQYSFEELCCKSLYNAVEREYAFAPSSPFSVAPAALRLAQVVGVSIEAVVSLLVE